jgi:hypothetical protein
VKATAALYLIAINYGALYAIYREACAILEDREDPYRFIEVTTLAMNGPA